MENTALLLGDHQRTAERKIKILSIVRFYATIADMDAQGRITYRAGNDAEKAAVERIRKYCLDTFGSDDDAAVIRFCIKTTEKTLPKLKAKQ